MDGPYEVMWSQKPITEETTDFTVVGKGEVPKNETKVSVTFTIPEAAYGQNFVLFRRNWRPEQPYSFVFMVVPDIKLGPTSGPPGTEVTIDGTGFPENNEEIKLSFDGKDTKLEIASSERGSFTAKFTIPDTIAGKHEFKTDVASLYIENPATSFQVRPKISLEPGLPEIGKEVTVSGIGFAASSQVSIKYDDIAISDSPTTDQAGIFSHSFKVPESSKDEHVITATDKAGNTATYGLPLEGEAPEAPNLVYPCEGERFGWVGPQRVAFKWQPVKDPSGVTYTLEVGPNTNVWPPIVIRTGLTSTTCVLDLEPGTYYWHVKAIDGAGNESTWTLSPYPFKIGLFSIWYLVFGGLLLLVIFIFIIRAFYRRLTEYLK